MLRARDLGHASVNVLPHDCDHGRVNGRGCAHADGGRFLRRRSRAFRIGRTFFLFCFLAEEVVGRVEANVFKKKKKGTFRPLVALKIGQE